MPRSKIVYLDQFRYWHNCLKICDNCTAVYAALIPEKADNTHELVCDFCESPKVKAILLPEPITSQVEIIVPPSLYRKFSAFVKKISARDIE